MRGLACFRTRNGLRAGPAPLTLMSLGVRMEGDVSETVLTILSSAISIVALFFSFVSFRRSHRTGIRPVLVFSNDSFDEGTTTTWAVENAGNGPALNVVLCGGASLQQLDSGEAVIVPSMSKGSKERLSFISRRHAFVAKYTDVDGVVYTTTCSNNMNRLSEKDLYPSLTGHRSLYEVRLAKKSDPAPDGLPASNSTLLPPPLVGGN